MLTSAAKLSEIASSSPQHKVDSLLLSPKKAESKFPLPPKIHRTSKDEVAVGLFPVRVFFLFSIIECICTTDKIETK